VSSLLPIWRGCDSNPEIIGNSNEVLVRCVLHGIRGLELSPRSDWEGVVHDADVVTGMAEDVRFCTCNLYRTSTSTCTCKKKGKGKEYSTLGK